MSDAAGIIARVRDGDRLSEADLSWFANGLASGAVSDAQAGAFAMAVLLKGLAQPDREGLTRAMRDSGQVLHWDLPAPVVDKHSTGGIGDSVSLLLAPALAACGVYVPMVSGRGLGHTGGTLDKLEAIPGFTTSQELQAFQTIVREAGCAIVAANAQIAPADRRLYAVRDVSATVESIDLITASILSKKLAAGLQALVLDVKCGSGAFMTDLAQATALAESLVTTANGAGCKTVALITDMDRPLAQSAGNALEVIEVIETLTQTRIQPRLQALTVELGGALLHLCGHVADLEAGQSAITAALTSGAAAERFGRMLTLQGADADFLETWRQKLPVAGVVAPVFADRAGRVAFVNMRALGAAIVDLGGGRKRDGDPIDPSVGLSALLSPGDMAAPHRPLAMIHAANPSDFARCARSVRAAFQIGADEASLPKLIMGRVGP